MKAWTDRLMEQQTPPARDARAEEALRRLQRGHDLQTASASRTLEVYWPWTFVAVDTTAGSVTLTLPAARTMTGYELKVKKMVAANTLTLDGDVSEPIDGATTLAWTTQYQSFTLICDGSTWHVV